MWRCIVLLLSLTHPFSCEEWQFDATTNSLYYVKFGGVLMNFVESENYCNSMGAHLASVHSFEESQCIQKVANDTLQQKSTSCDSLYCGSILFGLTGTDEVGRNYTDGTKVNYLNWKPGQPDNHGGIEYCTIIYWPPHSNAGQWNDVTCDRTWPSLVCKKPFEAKLLISTVQTRSTTVARLVRLSGSTRPKTSELPTFPVWTGSTTVARLVRLSGSTRRKTSELPTFPVWKMLLMLVVVFTMVVIVYKGLFGKRQTEPPIELI